MLGTIARVLAGVAVDDHGDIAVPLADRGLIDQQHPSTGGCGAAQQPEPTKTSTRARTACQCTPWRRAAALNVITFASATIRRARRAVERALEHRMVLQEPAVAVAAHHPAPLTTPTASPACPDTSRSRTFLARRSCTRWQLEPALRAPQPALTVDSTLHH